MHKKSLWLFVFLFTVILITLLALVYTSEGFQASPTQTACGFYYVKGIKRWICPTEAGVTALGSLKTGTDVAYVTACTAVQVGTVKHWLCPPNPTNGSRDHTAELVDVSGNSRVPFVGSDDKICFTYDLTAGIYYCKDRLSGNIYDDYTGTLSTNKDTTCDNLQKGLIDISGNIGDLTRLQANTALTWQTLKSARDSLNTMYTTYACAAVTGPNATICSIIKSGSTSIGGNFTDLDKLYSKTMDPATQLVLLKTKIQNALKEFKC
jgi:hypothetical protein